MGKIYGTCYQSNGSETDHYQVYVEYETGTPSISGNYTPVTVALKVRRHPDHPYSSSAYNLTGAVKVSLSIDGEQVYSTSSAKIDTRNAQIWTFTTKTKNVEHDDDGTKTVKISASFSNVGVSSLSKGSVSGSVELEDIARASVPTVSSSSVKMGNTVTINTNRKSDSFTHNLTYAFAGVTGTIKTGVGASCNWTVPDLVSKITGKSSGACTITCKTYSGSTLIGTETVKLTLNIPDKSQPTASASIVRMGTSVTINTNRKSTGFKHKMTYKLGNSGGTISTAVDGSIAWAPPKSLASYTGNKISAICTITCETYNGTLLVGSATIDITLLVPNATSPILSASTVVLGEKVVISTSKEAEVYAHDLTYFLMADGSSTVVDSGTIATNINAGYTWEVPIYLAAKIPSATKGTISVNCTTKFKDTTVEVGAKTVSFTVTVPNNSTTQPNVTMTLAPVSTLPAAFNDVYVAGKSKLKASYNATSDCSTIKSYETKLLTYSGNTNPYTSPDLVNPGTVTITGRVTDARGYFTEKTASITVVDYSRPRIIPGEGKNTIVCSRCNSDGKLDPGGVYLLIQIGRKYSKVVSDGAQKNFCKLSYQWKTDAAGDDSYTDPVVLLEKTATLDYVSETLPGIVSSNTTAYNIRLIAEDDVGETDSVTITVPTAFATWHSPPGGHGFTLGGYHDPAKVNVFDCRFDAEFQGDVYGRVIGLGKLPSITEGADANDYKEFGVYAVDETAVAATLVNFPEKKQGVFRVWSANGNGLITGEYVYIMQEFIVFDNSASYRRAISLDGPGSSWVYHAWRQIN